LRFAGLDGFGCYFGEDQSHLLAFPGVLHGGVDVLLLFSGPVLHPHIGVLGLRQYAPEQHGGIRVMRGVLDQLLPLHSFEGSVYASPVLAVLEHEGLPAHVEVVVGLPELRLPRAVAHIFEVNRHWFVFHLFYKPINPSTVFFHQLWPHFQFIFVVPMGEATIDPEPSLLLFEVFLGYEGVEHLQVAIIIFDI
jgi:hypothetical protein